MGGRGIPSQRGKTASRRSFRPVTLESLLNLDGVTDRGLRPNFNPYESTPDVDAKRKQRSPESYLLSLTGAPTYKSSKPFSSNLLDGSYLQSLDGRQITQDALGVNVSEKPQSTLEAAKRVLNVVATPIGAYRPQHVSLPDVFDAVDTHDRINLDTTVVDQSLSIDAIDKLMQKNLKMFAGVVHNNIRSEIDQVSSVLNTVIDKVNANSEAILAGERSRRQTPPDQLPPNRQVASSQSSSEDKIRAADRSFIFGRSEEFGG